jgi:hypothetical protein
MWKETTQAVYSAIFKQHGDELSVFGSFTSVIETPHHILTEWGFEGSETPLIKYLEKDGSVKCFIFVNKSTS